MRTAPANPRILNSHELLVFTNLVPDLGSDRFFRRYSGFCTAEELDCLFSDDSMDIVISVSVVM